MELSIFTLESRSIDKRKKPKRKATNTWHMCNAQHVFMITFMHQIEALKMIDGLLGFEW
jgi:hypothetical protein